MALTRDQAKQLRPLKFGSWNKASIFIGVTLISLVRSWGSLGRLPPDPGVDFYLEAKRDGVIVLFREEGGYLDLPRRTFSLIVALFPPEYWVVVGNVLWMGLIAICGVAVYSAISASTRSLSVGVFASITYVLSPAMSESQLGHDSVVKWPLLFLLSLTLIETRKSRSIRFMPLFIILMTGLSNLVSFSLFPMMLYQQRDGLKKRNLAAWTYSLAFLLTSVVQLLTWVQSGQGIQKYSKETIYLPWDGMGLFWTYNWLIVPIVAMPILCIKAGRHVFSSPRPTSMPSELCSHLLVSALLVWTTSYAIGGIADRYLVVPQTLVWIAMLSLVSPELSIPHRMTVGRLIGIGLTVSFSLASIKWFAPSQFLTSSPVWSDSVRAAQQQCSEADLTVVLIPQSINVVEIECKLLS